MGHGAGCPLCEGPGGAVIHEEAAFRVVRAAEAGYPAFYRVVWKAHVAEFSQLPAADRVLCMDAVACVEQALRDHLAPDKVNLAALGNMVPHLHWHVIARFGWDPQFPGAVWAAPLREADPVRLARIESLLPALETGMQARLRGRPGNCAPS